jgi:hypothetical protein
MPYAFAVVEKPAAAVREWKRQCDRYRCAGCADCEHMLDESVVEARAEATQGSQHD